MRSTICVAARAGTKTRASCAGTRDRETAGSKNNFLGRRNKDDQLRMIFACCHPALARESQVALTLKLLCGFNVEEIARAFITKSETIAKRLTRARERLRTDAVPFEIPSGPQLGQRLDAVLDVLYLLFNEGYNASQGDELIRRDLCDEAIRLTSLLARTSGWRDAEDARIARPAPVSSGAFFCAHRFRGRNAFVARPGSIALGSAENFAGLPATGSCQQRKGIGVSHPGRNRGVPLCGAKL